MAVKKKAKARPKAAKKAKAPVRAKRPAKRAGKSMSPEEMMAQWQAAAKPSEAHARLIPLVGTWKAITTFTMAPGDAPQVHEATSVNRMVLGGRYLEQIYKSPGMGMPFEGIGFTGFDNVRNRYVGTWMDSMGTGIMTSVGAGRPDDHRIDFVCEGIEPSGQKRVFDATIRIRDHAHHSYEMWTKGPNGKTYRTMLIEYERA